LGCSCEDNEIDEAVPLVKENILIGADKEALAAVFNASLVNLTVSWLLLANDVRVACL